MGILDADFDAGVPAHRREELADNYANELDMWNANEPNLNDTYIFSGAWDKDLNSEKDNDLVNCVEATARRVLRGYPKIKFNISRLALNVDPTKDPYSTIDELLDKNVATLWAIKDHVEGKPSYNIHMQGWMRQWGSGHSLRFDLSPHKDPFVLTCEGHSSWGNGLVARGTKTKPGLGLWRLIGNPGVEWWVGNEDKLPRFSELPWKFTKCCRMRVANPGAFYSGGKVIGKA